MSLVRAARMIFRHEPLPRIKQAASAGVNEAVAAVGAIVERARSKSERHVVFVTGVPGAGKTLLLEALGLLLGERGATELLRAGAEELRITGRFELERAELRAEVERILDTELADAQRVLRVFAKRTDDDSFREKILASYVIYADPILRQKMGWK